MSIVGWKGNGALLRAAPSSARRCIAAMPVELSRPYWWTVPSPPCSTRHPLPTPSLKLGPKLIQEPNHESYDEFGHELGP